MTAEEARRINEESDALEPWIKRVEVEIKKAIEERGETYLYFHPHPTIKSAVAIGLARHFAAKGFSTDYKPWVGRLEISWASDDETGFEWDKPKGLVASIFDLFGWCP